MEYFTTYSWQEGGGSLLLQEYLCRKIPACFAFLCSAEGERGREISDRLLSWNRRFPWHRAAREPGRWLERAEEELQEEMGAVRGPERFLWRLLVCVDQELLTLGNGYALYLLSGSFGQGSARRLGGSFRGCLEQEAGLLLAEEEFLENRPPQALAQVGRVWEIRTRLQADKRLKELAESGSGREGEPRTAILLLSKEDRDERESCGSGKIPADRASGRGRLFQGLSGGGRAGKKICL